MRKINIVFLLAIMILVSAGSGAALAQRYSVVVEAVDPDSEPWLICPGSDGDIISIRAQLRNSSGEAIRPLGGLDGPICEILEEDGLLRCVETPQYFTSTNNSPDNDLWYYFELVFPGSIDIDRAGTGTIQVTMKYSPFPHFTIDVIGSYEAFLNSPDFDSVMDDYGYLEVGLNDLALFATAYYSEQYNYKYDLDFNGYVGLNDLAEFSTHYTAGHHCGPVAKSSAERVDIEEYMKNWQDDEVSSWGGIKSRYR